MYNTGLGKLKDLNIEAFDSNAGYVIRRGINPALRRILKLATERKIIVESYPKLEKKKPYIFVSTHSFDEDIISCLATINRNAYVLIGTTDQLEHNPKMYAAWINGLVYVDRFEDKSRKNSQIKMQKVIEHGSSDLIFAEGGYNNTENLLCMDLFASPYNLNKSTKAPVVPMSVFHEHGSDKIYIRAAEPMDVSHLEKKEALLRIRDSLATMMYLTMEDHASRLTRSELEGDLHLKYMEERRQEYLRVKWTRDVWDEELTRYVPKDKPLPSDVRSFVDKVHVDKNNAYVLAPVLVKRLEDKKYDFKQYMKENWNR